MEEAEKKTFLKVKVAGKNKALWETDIREKFIELFKNLMDTVINFDDNKTIGEETKEISTHLIKHVKERLKRAGYENDKILAEIEEIQARTKKTYAEARKISAEARKEELAQKLKYLKLKLGIMKAMLIEETDSESIIFIKKIDVLFEVLKEFDEA